MSEQNKKQPDPTSEKGGEGFGRHDRPKWWSQQLETSWQGMKSALMEQMGTIGTHVKNFGKSTEKWEGRISEEAMAFGHAARERYKTFRTWSSALEQQLKIEWQEFKSKEISWESVRDAVRHAWEHSRPTPEASNPPPAAK